MSARIHEVIRARLLRKGVPFAANDNIAAHISEPERIALQREVELKVRDLLDTLLINGDDPNSADTPRRVAKMFITECMVGRFTAPPSITTFPNTRHLDEMIISGPISVRSLCSHHLCPIMGRCWIGIIPGKRLAGLSKYNRIVDWFARRPQIQEELAIQIADYLQRELQPRGVAVSISAEHLCMTWRGVEEESSARMVTNVMRGSFRKQATRQEFLSAVSG